MIDFSSLNTCLSPSEALPVSSGSWSFSSHKACKILTCLINCLRMPIYYILRCDVIRSSSSPFIWRTRLPSKPNWWACVSKSGETSNTAGMAILSHLITSCVSHCKTSGFWLRKAFTYSPELLNTTSRSCSFSDERIPDTSCRLIMVPCFHSSSKTLACSVRLARRWSSPLPSFLS